MKTTAERILQFAQTVEQLKSHTRTAWTQSGSHESVAAHSWRLALLAMVVSGHLSGIDTGRLIRMCLVHDLGETYDGDISAPLQGDRPDKSEAEAADVGRLASILGDASGEEIVELWREYEAGQTREALLAKALDKIETIIQHNQGRNPEEFDYGFNLGYGAGITLEDDIVRELRSLVDRDTAARAAEKHSRGR